MRSRTRTDLSTWRQAFVEALAETSNVTVSAKRAGVTPSQAYSARRRDPEFRQQWYEALCEGYEHLELETLYRLRKGQLKPPAGNVRSARVFDNATAMRLLLAHKETIARIRAAREDADPAAVRARIEARIEEMRTHMNHDAGEAEEGGATG